jgi:uncharacterized membrane protein YhaH (DUF805 family)
MFIFLSLVESLKNSFNFKGRASRFEISIFDIFYLPIPILLNLAQDYVLNTLKFPNVLLISSVFFILIVVTLIPGISVSVRRFHDIGKSGWFMLWGITIIALPYIWYLQFFKNPQANDTNYGSYSEPKRSGVGAAITLSLLAVIVWVTIMFLQYDMFNKMIKWDYALIPKTDKNEQIEYADRIVMDSSGRHRISVRVACTQGDAGIILGSQAKPLGNQPPKDEQFDVVDKEVQLKVITEQTRNQFADTVLDSENTHILPFVKNFSIDTLAGSEVVVVGKIQSENVIIKFSLKDDNVIKVLKSCEK